MDMMYSHVSSPSPLPTLHLSTTPTHYKATIAAHYSGVCCVCKFGIWTCLSGPCDLMGGEDCCCHWRPCHNLTMEEQVVLW